MSGKRTPPKCPYCPGTVEPSRSRCRSCLDKAAGWKRRRNAEGRCQCGDPVAADRSMCRPCLRAEAARRRREYARQAAAGLCVENGCHRKPADGHVRCRPHHQAVMTAIKASKQRAATKLTA